MLTTITVMLRSRWPNASVGRSCHQHVCIRLLRPPNSFFPVPSLVHVLVVSMGLQGWFPTDIRIFKGPIHNVMMVLCCSLDCSVDQRISRLTFWRISTSVWDLAEWLERLTVNAEVATVLGSVPASSETVESEGWQMKQWWIKYKKSTY
jgi:hypothetical protein